MQPLTYDTTDNEKELILPAIRGVKAILSAAAKTGKVQRVVLTSSFASVVDIARRAGPEFTYTAEHWNPLTYEEAIAPGTNAVVAYRGSKKFAELEACKFVQREKPSFDLVAFCPPMTFRPIVHPIESPEQLNESNARLWDVARGKPLPEVRVPVWIDVRGLALAHAEAVFNPRVGGKRYVPAAPEKRSYELAASILRSHYPAARQQVVPIDHAVPPESYDLDGKAVMEDLGVQYHDFKTTVIDLFEGLEKLGMSPWQAT
jgi:nucleoside-diphosphate-sugar epimerase